MKAKDFNLPKELKYFFDKGETVFQNNRVLIYDANSIGFLRQTLVQKLGLHETRKLLLQFGYVSGYTDFMQIKTNYNFDDEIELYKTGTVLHCWKGIVKVVMGEFYFNRENGEFFSKGYWLNSFEAEQHLIHNEISKEPVCWTLMGYSSGWASAFFGTKLISIETECVGMGHDKCKRIIKPEKEWTEDFAKPYIEALKDF